MAKQKEISSPKIGMNRSVSPHLLGEREFAFQLNGNSYDEGGEKFNLTDEHSNILASKFKEGFKFVGGRNHVVRDKTYIMLTNPVTEVSEIGCIRNVTDFNTVPDREEVSSCTGCNEFVNSEATPLEGQEQVPHQTYETLLEDSCNLCLGFDINYPIIDIIIKEENIGTTMWWTSTPGNKEFRYLELDDIQRYKTTGDDNCGATPDPVCLDCDKLRVFKLYTELKTSGYQRVVGGNLKKGSYELLAAYTDQLGNEFTSYTPLTPIIPIFDEANIIHEQEDNNAETNFAIKVELDTTDIVFDFYKVVVRYYTSNGVFTSFEEGIHNTSDKIIILSDNNGIAISNTAIALKKPFVETVDGITASNNVLVLTGVREREPINLQPVMSLAGLGVQWMSFRAKEDLYANADSYRYAGYNRDENEMFSIDFGFRDGYRTPASIFVPRPATEDEMSPIFNTSGNLIGGQRYVIRVLQPGDDFTNLGFEKEREPFTSSGSVPLNWSNSTEVHNWDSGSITSIVGDCDGVIRDKKWQFYNTATETGDCPLNEDLETVTQTEIVVTYTDVDIPSVPAGGISIEPSQIEDFISLKTYIEDNQMTCQMPPYIGSPVQDICQYIDLDNLGAFNNEPVLIGDCTSPTLVPGGESVEVVGITGEQQVNINKELGDYSRLRPTDNCSVYVEMEQDEEFSSQYSLKNDIFENPPSNAFLEGTLLRRRNVTYSDTCQSAKELFVISQDNIANGPIQSFIHPYYGVEQVAGGTTVEQVLANAVENKTALYEKTYSFSDIGGKPLLAGNSGVFTSKIHKGALWFKIDVSDKKPLLVEISKLLEAGASGYRLGAGVQRFRNREVRVHFFENCNSIDPIGASSYEDGNGVTVFDSGGTNPSFGGIYPLNSAPTLIPIDQSIVDSPGIIGGFIYMVIDLPLSGSYGLGEGNFVDDDPVSPIIATAVTIPLNSCFTVNVREIEFSDIQITFDEVVLRKRQQYTSACTFEIPVLQDCEPVPFKYGDMGYFESTEKYPDNPELYDSSSLIINKDNITNTDFLLKLGPYINNETPTQIILSEEADFTCKNIRGYKFPDNKVSPFINTQETASNSDSVISPLGVTIDGEVLDNLLEVAVDNNLLTREQKEDIVDYRIYRADSTLDRSVVSSGLVFNTKSYSADGEKINYFNYPFNSLGKDKYFPDNMDEPFNKIQVISPEFDYFQPSLPTEMSLQGFQFGKSNSRVLPVEDHSKMVILGDKARSLANTLAILEVTAEVAIAAAQAVSNAQVWVTVGTSSGTSIGIPAYIASGIILAIGVTEGLVGKVARYRTQWEQSFEDLGTPYNFGYYTAAGSKYNYLKTLQIDGDRLRGLSVRKYLTSGMLNVSDTTSGEVIKLNNIDREDAPFFTLGNFPIEDLPGQYLSFDNSDSAPNFSSQILSSETSCDEGKSTEQLRNIASPYVAFKNYIPNQYGTVDSIKWVDTTYCIPIGERGVCNGILGGDTFISRHSKKRKARMFESDLLGQADLTPFPYRFNSNYGDPEYYIDFKVNSEFTSGNKSFPYIFYDVRFDCVSSTNGFYVEPPGKFYLYSIAFTNFLCETRINTNFRNARKEPWNQFYPQNTDYEAITQPTTVSLTRKEPFFYNKAYLQTSIQNTTVGLPEYYSSEDEAAKAYNINSGIYSLPDVNENSITEPWLLYRPNDRFTLESRYGNLTNMKGIESGQVLMYFEDALQLQNAVNKFTDGSTQYNSELGNGGMFAKRALTLRSTDLGYGGTQSKNTLSCEFGHFHADMKRGQIFNYTGGTDMQEVSRYSNNKPNGMDIWFKEHLPMKLLKRFPDFECPDNPYNGIGIHWGYDSKYRRVLLTKKDYIPIAPVINCGKKLYDSDLDSYRTTIDGLTGQGYSFEGIEDCQLKFTQEGGIPQDTDIYAFFDTTSMILSDGQAASDALQTWFSGYRADNPSYQGSLYILPFGSETYLSYLPSIKEGIINTTQAGGWGGIAILPDNLNTPQWVPPTEVLLLAFVDESHSQYHAGTVSDGFSAVFQTQPTDTYFSTYLSFLEAYNNDFTFFKGVLYPIVKDIERQGGALVLQSLAAIEGTVLTQQQIDDTNTTVDVSLLLTENPYTNAPIPNTSPQENLRPLKELGWQGQYDKTSPASDVFDSQQFQDDLNDLLLEDGEENATTRLEPLNEVRLTDTDFFKEVSWTITYRPETGSWESYMSYTPNYYINHTDYFQSGLNTDDSTFGLWSHLLSNKSYRVFYGQKYPYIFEYPVKNQYISKRLESLNWNAQLRRYHNEYDFATIESNPFTAVTIYNNYENSGRLVPVLNNGTVSQLSKYPITNMDNTQNVLVSYDNYRYNMGYFYNRMRSNVNNQPAWLWDENQIDKEINPKAVSFYGKRTLERLKGNFFLVRLERDGNTNYDLDFRWAEQTVNPIQ